MAKKVPPQRVIVLGLDLGGGELGRIFRVRAGIVLDAGGTLKPSPGSGERAERDYRRLWFAGGTRHWGRGCFVWDSADRFRFLHRDTMSGQEENFEELSKSRNGVMIVLRFLTEPARQTSLPQDTPSTSPLHSLTSG